MSDSRQHTPAPSLPFPGPSRRPAAAANVVPMRLRLSPGRLAVEVTRSGTVFGRHSTADVRLPLPDVSRRHCRFVCADGRWQVIDLGSLNGVFVNDALVQQAELQHRDRVRIGGFVFEVDLRAGEQTVHLGEPDDVIRSITDARPPSDGERRRAS